MENGNGQRRWSFPSGFFVGGIIGALAGILLAPKAGSETRTRLLEHGETLRLKTGDMRERIGPAMVDMRQRITPVVDRLSSRFVRRPASTTHEDGQEAELAAAVHSGTESAEQA